MKKLVAIGGASYDAESARSLDESLVRLTEKTRPRILALQAFRREPQRKAAVFHDLYVGDFGCRLEAIALDESTDRPAAVENAVREEWARFPDVIYLATDDTAWLMERLRTLGLDRWLCDVARAGTTVAAAGAAAGCLFARALAERPRNEVQVEGHHETPVLRVSGLGLIPLLACSNFQEPGRAAATKNVVAKFAEIAVAIDRHAALVIEHDRFHVWHAERHHAAYRVLKHGWDTVVERLSPETGALADLLSAVPCRAHERQPRTAQATVLA